MILPVSSRRLIAFRFDSPHNTGLCSGNNQLREAIQDLFRVGDGILTQLWIGSCFVVAVDAAAFSSPADSATDRSLTDEAW